RDDRQGVCPGQDRRIPGAAAAEAAGSARRTAHAPSTGIPAAHQPGEQVRTQGRESHTEPGGHRRGTPKRVDTMPNVGVTENLVSIIVPCLGQLEYTKLCVPSVLKWSREPFELIFLDIGSLDGTAEYLAGVQAAAKVRVEIVRAETGLGIREACREGMAQASGQYIVLLNNETIVTSPWLDQMISLFKVSPTIGIVGPMSNYAAPPQLVESIPYRFNRKSPKFRSSGADVELDAVESFAR